MYHFEYRTLYSTILVKIDTYQSFTQFKKHEYALHLHVETLCIDKIVCTMYEITK